jgi:hypothetical protein
MTTENAAIATVESLDDAQSQSDVVRLWLDAIGVAGNEEETWRKSAQDALDLYRQSGEAEKRTDLKKFNILHANVEVICPALYNSLPVPDVRRRFGDADPVAKTVADVQERCLQYSVEAYDFDHLMKLATKDSEIIGRSVDRVRYKPYTAGEEGKEELAFQEVICEHVNGKHFRRGPGHTWEEVPWIAFELFLTRDELRKLAPKYAEKVNLDVAINKPSAKADDREIPEIFKRARVWEIWDKDHRKVIFIAESFKERPIREEEDPLELEAFYPIPRPLYAVTTSNSLVPVVPYEIYKAQAEELERVSERILSLTEAVKAKALYDARITEMERLENAEDTDNVPIENVSIFADGSKLADHVMFYPIEVITAALEKLYLARDQIKATIYEITGISDIIRGATDPNETLGAQQLKASSSNLRIQHKQTEIQRYARDIFRIKAEIFASKFEPQYLEMMTGIPLVPQETDPPEVIQQKQAVMQMLRTDKLRGFRVDVESDSTIRADMQRHQQAMSQYMQATAQFGAAMGPLVMADKTLMPAVMQVFASMSRQYKIGRSAEDAIDKVIAMSEQRANEPPQPDPAQQAEQAKLQLEQQKAQIDQQTKQAEMQMKMQESQAKIEADRIANEQKLAFEAQRHAQEMEFEREKHQNEIQMKSQEMAMNQQNADREHMTREREIEQTGSLKREEMVLNSQDKAADRQVTVQEGEANRNLEAEKIQLPKVNKVIEKATAAIADLQGKIESMAEEISAPAEIIRDKAGRAAGIRKGKRQMTIKRGPDGRAVGIQ